MNSELIMKMDVLDILFEKRNKAYGAYALRKFYNNRLLKSLAIMMVSVIAFSAFTFLPQSEKKVAYFVFDPGFTKIVPSIKAVEAKPTLNQRAKPTPVSTVKLLSIVRIVDNKDSVDILRDLENRAIGSNTNIILRDNAQQVFPPVDTNEVVTGPVKASGLVADLTKPVDNPEIMPQYPGGVDALRKFLKRNLNNPRDLDEGEIISVKITFVVGYDGKLKHFELTQDGGSEFNNEVIRVLKKMPIWVPGKTKGQNVSVYYTIPVKFIPQG